MLDALTPNAAAQSLPTVSIREIQGEPLAITEGERVGFEVEIDRLPERYPLRVSFSILQPQGLRPPNLLPSWYKVDHRNVGTATMSFYPAGVDHPSKLNGHTTDNKKLILWIQTLDDDVHAPVRLGVLINDGSGYNVGNRSVTVQMLENDPNPNIGCWNCVWVETNHSGVPPGNMVTFTVHALPAPIRDLHVEVIVRDAPGRADFLDHRGQGAHRVTIAGGSNQATLTIPTRSNPRNGPNRHITAVATGQWSYGALQYRNDEGTLVDMNDEYWHEVAGVRQGAEHTPAPGNKIYSARPNYTARISFLCGLLERRYSAAAWVEALFDRSTVLECLLPGLREGDGGRAIPADRFGRSH